MGDRRSAARRGYNARWRRYRERFLMENPFCVLCRRAGRVSAATVVDHVRPHRGDHRLFWDPANHQAVCKPCHDGDKQRAEKGSEGYAYRGCDVDGLPLDPSHHWRAQA